MNRARSISPLSAASRAAAKPIVGLWACGGAFVPFLERQKHARPHVLSATQSSMESKRNAARTLLMVVQHPTLASCLDVSRRVPSAAPLPVDLPDTLGSQPRPSVQVVAWSRACPSYSQMGTLTWFRRQPPGCSMLLHRAPRAFGRYQSAPAPIPKIHVPPLSCSHREVLARARSH